MCYCLIFHWRVNCGSYSVASTMVVTITQTTDLQPPPSGRTPPSCLDASHTDTLTQPDSRDISQSACPRPSLVAMATTDAMTPESEASVVMEERQEEREEEEEEGGGKSPGGVSVVRTLVCFSMSVRYDYLDLVSVALRVCVVVGSVVCLTSEQHASTSQGRFCSVLRAATLK